jgi:hypothetical protein
MVKYQLTTKQKDILRAASTGLHDGSVSSQWILVMNRSDLHQVKGFPNVVDLGVDETDFRVLLECGFLRARIESGQNRTFDVMEQRIHDAISSEFEDPGSPPLVAPTSGIRIEQGAGSNLNIAIHSKDVTQTINTSPSLPSGAKADLEREVEALYKQLEESQNTKPHETKSLEKHLKRLVEDAAETEPDRDDVTNSLSRLERASQALASFTGIATSINKIGDIVDTLPFMQ